jgi:hypothetical protein
MKTIPSPRSWFLHLACWNWKCAALTALIRGSACMAALRHAQPHARQHFSMVEIGFALLTSGLFSGWQQRSLRVTPRRLGWVIAVIALPLTSLALDALVHTWLDGIKAHALGIGALAFTLVSAMFHWHIMQNGTMLVGETSSSFMSDMRRMPLLLASFVMEPINKLRKRMCALTPDEFEIAA